MTTSTWALSGNDLQGIITTRTAERVNLIAFSLLLGLAWLRPLAPRRRRKATAIGAAAISVIVGAQYLRRVLPPLPVTVIRDWLPAPLWLMVYWQAGQFFTRPWTNFQSRLLRLDDKLLGTLARRGTEHTWFGAYFELAYLLCYPLVPLGLSVLYIEHMGRYADTFWAAVLPPTYLCYLALPFIQTLPPRMPDPNSVPEAHGGLLRRLNFWILRHASIQANTFPSAHVAASMAVALILLRLVPQWGWVFLLASLSIAAGSVMGRYHYATDALLGMVVAVAWFLLAQRPA